jgi:NAD(P)-dependent dehydrogenase (short-subunit alcohol dehydrogenase family)
MNLKGKNIIVTGGTKGIGAAVCDRFAEEGSNLVIVSRTKEDCEQKAESLRKRAKGKSEIIPYAIDIANPENAEMLVAETVERLGRIDILINNAGVGTTKRAEEITPADWDAIMDINLRGTFFLAQRAGAAMIKQGKGVIVNVASALGLVATKGVLPYCVSKAGVIQMTRALAVEWAEKNIRVNAICPGYIITDINREELSKEKTAEKLLRKTAMKRFGEKEEIAEGILYLASDSSSYMTGQTLVLDGGWTAL